MTNVALLEQAQASALPAPPSDQEKVWYMGRQHRWLLLAQAASFSLIAYSILRFATADTRLLLFLVPMSLYGITLLVSLLSSTRRKRTDLIDHEVRVHSWAPALPPSVDVFLPTAGEPLAVLENTYRHVAQLRAPGDLTVHVLDDAARQEVEDLAAEHGFRYLSRPDRGHLKKAGNLKYGYQHSTGDVIFVLDADFAPRPDALTETLPYFDEPDVAIVQTPQFFDTTRQMNWLQRSAGATQEMFYRWIQPSRDRSKAAICVGTCALYRRSALERAGGFAQIGHSEDVHTGVNIMKAGLHVRYVPILISKGLCPDTASAYLNQQYRWCTGSMSLLADRSFHNARQIGFRQRLCFWSGFLYYISTALNVFVAPLPALAMLYFLPKWIEPMNSVWLLGAIALWFVVLPLVMKGRWRVEVLRVQVLYSFAHAVAIVDMLTGRTKEWVATGSTGTRSTPVAVSIGRVTKAYVALTYGLIWFGLVHGALTYGLQKFWAMILLAVLGSYIHLPLLRIRTAGSQSPVPAATTWASTSTGAPASAAAAAPRAVTPPRDLTPEASGPRRFRPDIQGLRAIAVALVVLYHASVPHITGGYVGVDVFFVISGFLITGQLIREVAKTGRVHFGVFYANRMRRLIPPAAIVLIVTLLVARIFGSPFQFRQIATHAAYTAGYLLNYRLAHEGVNYQNANGPISPLQHFWSLAVEEQYYIVWPLLLMICVLIARRRRLWLTAMLLAAIVAVSLRYSISLTRTDAPLAYFSLHTRAWELAAGALVALASPRLSRQPGWTAAVTSWAGVGMIVASALLFTDNTPFPGSAAILPVAGAALVIMGGCRATRGSAEVILDRWPMQGIGAVSYSWYLWHWPIIVLAPFVFGHSFGWGSNLELMLIALWIATLSYWVVESPTRRSRLRKLLWAGLGTGMSGAVAATSLALIATMPPLVGAGAAAVSVNLNRGGLLAVERAVGKATELVKAPSNLTPTLDDARKDQPVTSRNGCHLDYTLSHSLSAQRCTYGDRTRTATHTAVLLGDSHAQQWLPGLDKAARDKHWRLIAWTKAACPLANVTVYNTVLRRNFTECNAWRADILDRVKLMRPDLVIVSQSNSVPGDSVTNPDWAEQTVASVGVLQRAHIPVVYLGDTPYHVVNVPECVARHLDDVGSCTVRRAHSSAYRGRAELLAQDLKAAHVAYLDPLDWFCTERDCPPIVGNLLVYRDESHMSTSYSYYLAPLLKPLFKN